MAKQVKNLSHSISTTNVKFSVKTAFSGKLGAELLRYCKEKSVKETELIRQLVRGFLLP